jgi:hypothetical protein
MIGRYRLILRRSKKGEAWFPEVREGDYSHFKPTLHYTSQRDALRDAMIVIRELEEDDKLKPKGEDCDWKNYGLSQ